MSHPIPADAQRLADRLRSLADEIESAARYGVPIPFGIYANGHEFGRAGFSATPAEFDAWADYTEAVVTEYDHAGYRWATTEVDVNGLPLTFTAKGERIAAEVTA